MGDHFRLAFAALSLLLLISPLSPLLAQEEERDLSGVIVFVPIEGEITERLCRKVAADVEECAMRGARLIVLRIDTTGGDYLAASDLAGKIFALRRRSPRVDTFAYIPNGSWAISAGALIAFSCENLVMGDNTHIGDVEPRNLLGPLDEKTQSLVRNDLTRYAKDHPGWPLPIVEAMVTRELAVYEVIERNSTGSRKRYLMQEELDVLPEGDRARLEARLIVRAGELVTLDEQEALAFGFIEKIYSTRNQFIIDAGISEEPMELEDALGRNVTLGDSGAFAWMAAHPFPGFVKFLLILIGVVGLVIELKMPGFGVGGILFLLCFITFFVEGFATNHVGWVELICFPVSLGLLGVEMFVIPGFGVAGITGLALLLASLVMALTPESERLSFSTFTDQLLTVLLALASSVVVTFLILRFLPGGKGSEGGGLISTTSLRGNSTIAESGTDPSERPSDLIGRRGTVVHALRPAGKAEFAGVLRDVVAVGEFLAAGTSVEIAGVEGNRIVVRSVAPEPGN